MTEPIMCLAASGSPDGEKGPSPDSIEVFAEAGFNYVCYWGGSANSGWERTVKLYHDHGFKVITRWPIHDKLKREECFQSYDGQHNDLGDTRIYGPSHWHPAPVGRAADSIHGLYEVGFDGVLVSCLECDRPFPTDWYGRPEHIDKTICFWSFDAHAQADWQYHSGTREIEPWMPPRADILRVPTFFYTWYQAGWLRRVCEYTGLAEDAGFKNIWTWFTPLTAWTAEGAANGTAHGVASLHGVWYEQCEQRGLNPVVVSPVVINLWPQWVEAAVMSMRQACEDLGWRAIAGPGCNEGHEVATKNLRERAPVLADIGFRGVYAGMTFLEGKEDLAESGQQARKTFEDRKTQTGQERGAEGC